MGDLEKAVEEKNKALKQMKAKNQKVDDQNMQLVSEVTSQISEANQKGIAKRRTLQENASRIQRLQSEVCVPASMLSSR